MIYALNVFNLVPGRENDYRDYSIKAGRIIFGLGGRVVSAGTGPLREMHGDTKRRQLIVVEFPSLEIFEQFIDEAENQNIHHLRENSTTDYIWTLQANRDVHQLVIDTQGGPGAPGAANCRGLDGTLNTTPDIKVTGWYCPSTGRIHLVHRNLESKIAVRVFIGNVSDNVIGQPLYMAGTMTVLFSAFGDLGEYNFSAVKQ